MTILRTLALSLLLPATCLFGACGDNPDDDHGHAHGGDHAHEGGDHDHEGGDHDHEGGDHDHEGGDHSHEGGDHDHGKRRPLGTSAIGAWSVEVVLYGEIVPGEVAHMDIVLDGEKAEAVRIWIGGEDAAGVMKARIDEGAAGEYHGHVDVTDPLPEGAALWIEIEDQDGGRALGSVALP